MTFKLQPDPTFKSTVAITAPGDTAPTISLIVTWRHKTRTQYDAWLAKPALMAKDGQTLGDAAYLDEVMVSWDGPVTESGEAVAYSLASLETLLNNYQPAARELYDAYCAALTESRAKN